MSGSGWFSRQISDFLAYLLLPLLAVVTPGSFSRRMLRYVSRWRWFLSGPAGAALAGAAQHGRVVDEAAWLRDWKRVELLDARDLFMMLLGRSGTVLAEIECSQPIENVRGLPLVGMHWGPGISVLKLLAVAGLEPSFPYRPPQVELLKHRPFRYIASRVGEPFMSGTLREGAVHVGGAGQAISRLLNGDGSVCVLMDAPPMTGRGSMRRTVLDRPARFNAGFPGLLQESGKDYYLWAMNLSEDGSLRKQLELSGPFSAGDSEAFTDNFAAFLDRHLRGPSWHWRIWHAEEQFWD